MKRNRFQGILEKRWFAYTLAAFSAVLLYMVLSKFQSISARFDDLLAFLRPVIIGVAIAYLLNPLVNFFDQFIKTKLTRNEKLSHTLAVIAAVLLFMCVITIIFMALIPYLVKNIASLGIHSGNYTVMIDKGLDLLEAFSEKTGLDMDEIIDTVSQTLNKNGGLVPKGIKAAWDTSVSVGVAMGNALIGFIIAIYFMMDKWRISKAIDRLRRAVLSENVYRRNSAFWSHCNSVFIRYIGYSMVDALIIGLANMCFMLTFGMPYVALVSVIVALTNLLPTVGPLIGGLIGGLILVIYKPITALWFILFTLFLQTIDGYVIKPRLFGNSLGIPPVLTLIAIILGGKAFGIIGVFLSIPVTSVLIDLYNSSLLPRLEARKNKAGPAQGEEDRQQ